LYAIRKPADGVNMQRIRGIDIVTGMKLRSWIGAIILACTPAAHASPPQPAVVPFDLADVKLLDGPIKQKLDLNRQYLLSLDVDRLLHVFRVNAGIPSTAKPLGGWESPDCELRGHFVGHYLSACALMYQATGDPQIKANADKVVAGLAECQAKLGDDGYLSAFPTSLFDRLEAGKPVWAPYYTIHKIMAGLLDVNQAWGNKTALDIDVRMARYFDRRLKKLGESGLKIVWRNEFGGMMEVAENLYAETDDPAMLDLAEKFDQPSFFDPLAAGQDRLQGLHANTHIPKVIGMARKYELTGDERSKKIATFFWDEIANHRAFATGGTSTAEFWQTPPDVLAHELAPNTAESCCTYNMLKLTDHLFQWDAKPDYEDYYERAWWNSVLPVQQPKTGMLEYYQSLLPDTPKVFSTPTDSFWCCVGTGVESFSKLAGCIYYHSTDHSPLNGMSVGADKVEQVPVLEIAQFVASEVTWKDRGVVVRMETDFPESGEVKLIVMATDKEKPWQMHVRIPKWAAAGSTMSSKGGAPIPISGRGYGFGGGWRVGDTIKFSFKMQPRLQPMPDDPAEVAVMYGPLVLAADLGETRARHGGDRELLGEASSHGLPPLIVDDKGVPSVTVKDGTFTAQGADGPITLVPLYQLFDRNYTVYFRTTTADGGYVKKFKALADTAAAFRARVIDEVLPDDRASEQSHHQQGNNTSSGAYAGGHWRHAPGGWFSWDLAVDPAKPNVLVCQYWGGDQGRVFDISVNGTKLATQALTRDKPGEFWTVEYPIPATVTAGKTKVTVRFEAAPGSTAGGVFGAATLRETGGPG
jgi:DUF1680 family protein